MSTDVAARNAKPGEKSYKLAFGDALYLYVTPSGGKLWRFNYRFEGKGKTLSFGAYPIVSLKDARARRDDAKKLLANGQDPGAIKAARKAAVHEQEAAQQAAVTNSFEAVARQWFEVWRHGKAPQTAIRQWSNLERHVFPDLGGLPVSGIKAKAILNVLRKMEDRGLGDSVLKAKIAISQVMRHAVQYELAERDPTPDLKGGLKATKTKHMAAITDPVAVGALLRAIEGYQGQTEVKAALRLAPLVFVRPGELRRARWADIDLEKGEWRYTTSKTETPHIVPLARQAVEILRGLHAWTGGGELVFPGLVAKDRPISNSTINSALHRMGYDTQTEMTGHGFRAMARTLLAEELDYPPEVIEHQLAHGVSDALGRAYNRTKYLKVRRDMMQEWADYLDELKAGAKVIPIRAQR